MRICLVDDDSTQLDYLKMIIEEWASKKNINTDMSFYHSAEEMLFENNKSYPFDMIVLDIQMGRINGIELARRIRETDKSVIIAFISGMADYVFEGYEVHAIRYILKPVVNEKVYELLDYANSQKTKESRFIVLSFSGEKKKINYDDIIYFESMGHYVVFHLENEELEKEFENNKIEKIN